MTPLFWLCYKCVLSLCTEDKNTTTTDADEDNSREEKPPRSRKQSSTEKERSTDPQDAEKVR